MAAETRGSGTTARQPVKGMVPYWLKGIAMHSEPSMDASSEKLSSEAAADARALYLRLVEDIQTYKQRQWTVAYYSFILYAALVGLSEIAESPNLIRACGAAALAVLIVTLVLLVILQIDLAENRKKVGEMRERLVYPRQNDIDRPIRGHYLNPLHRPLVFFVLCAFVLAGGLFVVVYLWTC